jgi:hypothetical protein
MPPPPGFAPWPTTISIASQARRWPRVEAIARRQYLIDEDLRLAALFRAHAAITGRRAGPGRGGAAAQRPLGIGAERAKAHSGDRNGDLQLDRLFGKTGAERHVSGATLAIAFERVARDRGAQQYEVVETRQRAQSAEAADLVEAFIGSAFDLRGDFGGKGGRAPQRRYNHRQYSVAWSMWKLYRRRAEP